MDLSTYKDPCWEEFGQQLIYHEFFMGLFPVLSDYIMAVNYLMSALSLYQIYCDKSIKGVFSLIYIMFFALDLWWVVVSTILMTNQQCIPSVTET